MISMRRTLLSVAMIALAASPAFADITGFIGANTTPSNRLVKGGAVGFGLIFALEFEYSTTNEDIEAAAPSLKVGTGNALIQPPMMIMGLQPYAVVGVGVYRERLGDEAETGGVFESGAGVKIALAGPVRLRIDYRVFKLSGDPLHTPVHRIYGGLNLKF